MNDFLNTNIFDVPSDLYVIPISTEGTLSNSFRKGLDELYVSTENLKKNYKLGDIEFFYQKDSNTYIAFVCTVDDFNSAYYAIRLIGKRLAKKILEVGGIKEIVTPILGTGAGKLIPQYSLNIMRTAFYEFNEKFASNVRLSFCTPDESIYNSVKALTLDIDTPSAQLVIKAEINRIRINGFVEKIQFDNEFYFELSIQKFSEYIRFRASSNSFYGILKEKFKTSGLTFKEFVISELSKEQLDFTILCGELIAYIDYNAYHKNIWNIYPDKRIFDRSTVHQKNWFLNLIKFKQTNDINSVSSSVKNALLYLKSPEKNLTMLSENHRMQVFESIFPKKYYKEIDVEMLFTFFRKAGIKPQNPKNSGALYSRILYLPFIQPIWNETVSKDAIFEENIEYTNLSLAGSLIEKCLKNKSKKLDLGNCGLRDLSIIPELFECTHIEELILSNEWAEFKNGKWSKLISINKGNKNNIQFIPDSISKLSELKILICGGDWNEYEDKDWNRWGISAFTPITKLKQLEYLNLSNNNLTSLVGLNKLTNLKIAHLNNNKISKSEVFNSLTQLKELYLSNNKIKSIDFISNLQGIKTLDLHNNQIKDLRPLKRIIEKIGIRNDKWEKNTLNIAKNPLEQPPMEIVNLGKDAVLGLFRDIEKGGHYINKDIKILLVGNSEVGKSTLVKYLDKETGLEDEHLPTLWLDEKIINSKYSITTLGEECLLHIFDFGGHDFYHDTHHLFFSTNTIYVLLWDKETNRLNLRKSLQMTRDGMEIEIETQDYPLKYWLDSVKFHTKNIEADKFEFEIKREVTYSSSVLVIQNKVSDASKTEFQDNKALKKDYPFIYDIINISIKKPKRNLEYFDSLFLEMLNNMNIIGAILPKFYKVIKDSILLYVGKPIITILDFLDYCNSKIPKIQIDIDQCRVLVKYLEQVGVLLYTNNGFEEKIYIDKKWVIGSMHKILEKLKEKKGEFNKDYVVKIFGNDDGNIDDVLLMMQEFKMIFKHPYSDAYIAPLYLPKIPDGKISIFLNKIQIPFRRFEYSGFIHKSVILSIFQKFGTLFTLDKNKDIFYYWKDGLVIKNPDTEEIIMIKFHLENEDGKACIDIYELSNTNSHNFRDDVLNYIREVNQYFEIEEMVTLDGVDYISKSILNHNANIGKHIFSEKKKGDLKILKQQEKLFKLKDYKEFIDNPVKKKKVVISYSKKDLAHTHTLRRYLQPLVDDDLIEQPWNCTYIYAGEDWDTKIKQKFQEADIVFFMVSEYFYSTKYIIDNEIKTAIDRYLNKENIKIIPIILEFYDWGRKEPYNLQKFAALPYQLKPISDFSNPKIAWNIITASVRMMIEKDLDPGKIEMIGRDLEEIYERQVKGKLDNNSY